jgi:hypothetical protein
VIVLDGSKEPKGESGIVHSLKAKPPYARAAVFGGCSPASAIDRTICKRSRRAVSFPRLDGMINSRDSAERWHAPGSTAAGGGFKSVRPVQAERRDSPPIVNSARRESLSRSTVATARSRPARRKRTRPFRFARSPSTSVSSHVSAWPT